MGASSLESDWFYSKKEGRIEEEEERWTCRNSESESKENR